MNDATELRMMTACYSMLALALGVVIALTVGRPGTAVMFLVVVGLCWLQFTIATIWSAKAWALIAALFGLSVVMSVVGILDLIANH